jgi:hypothetical protein
MDAVFIPFGEGFPEKLPDLQECFENEVPPPLNPEVAKRSLAGY